MTFLEAIILGIVEGISEFLPISSTGHLILATRLLGIPQSEFVKTFEIAIQLGAIGAVVLLYARRLLTNFETLKRVGAAFIPTAVIGLLVYRTVKHYLLGNTIVVIWALLIGGIAIIAFEMLHKKKEDAVRDIAKISYPKTLAIGTFQTLAFIPGVSRSAATIIGGLMLGIERTTIVEMSFLLAVPTMAAATGLDLIKNAGSFSSNEFAVLLVGLLTSFTVAIFAIRFFLRFIKTHTLIWFGAYRIAVAVVFALMA